MSEQEINKIIAEYMGYRSNGDHLEALYRDMPSNYTKSLDALVPVVEKLRIKYYEMCHQGVHGFICNFRYDNVVSSGESPSLALSTACAKVIKGLHE